MWPKSNRLCWNVCLSKRNSAVYSSIKLILRKAENTDAICPTTRQTDWSGPLKQTPIQKIDPVILETHSKPTLGLDAVKWTTFYLLFAFYLRTIYMIKMNSGELFNAFGFR